MGPMVYSEGQQKGVRAKKDYGLRRVLTMRKASSYADIVNLAQEEFFEGHVSNTDTFYLANSEGIMISDRLPDGQWTPEKYLEFSGLYPSRIKLYIVK